MIRVNDFNLTAAEDVKPAGELTGDCRSGDVCRDTALVVDEQAGYDRRLARSLCSRGDVSLFLDVDGTLLDFAYRADEVLTPVGLGPTIARLERKLSGALALVSGRPIAELDRLFRPLRLRASGVHGAEMRFHPDEAAQIADDAAPLPAMLRTALDVGLSSFEGAFAEDKGFSVAVHYRATAAATCRLRAILEDLIASEPRLELEIINGHNVLELKTRGVSKGKAIAAFLDVPPFLGRTPIFVGDDETDKSGFATVAARGGVGFSVGVRRPGTSGVFENPRAVRQWLAAFAAGRQRE